MIKKTGTIEAVTKDGKRFKLDDGAWYSCFKASELKAGKGDYVSFTYVENGTFNNVKGSVDSLTAPADTKPSGGGMMGAPVKPPAAGYSGGRVFPVPALSPERSIIRQNSLNHASRVVCEIATQSEALYNTFEEAADRVIAIARMFEAYSCGDLDMDIADGMVKMALASEADR